MVALLGLVVRLDSLGRSCALPRAADCGTGGGTGPLVGVTGPLLVTYTCAWPHWWPTTVPSALAGPMDVRAVQRGYA